MTKYTYDFFTCLVCDLEEELDIAQKLGWEVFQMAPWGDRSPGRDDAYIWVAMRKRK